MKQTIITLALVASVLAAPNVHGRGHSRLHNKLHTAPTYGYNPKAAGATGSAAPSYPSDNCTESKVTASATGGYANITTTFTDSSVPTVNPTNTVPASYGQVAASYSSAHSSAVVVAAGSAVASPGSSAGAPANSPADAATTPCERDITITKTVTICSTVYETGSQGSAVPAPAPATSSQVAQPPVPAPAPVPATPSSSSSNQVAPAATSSAPKAYSPPASVIAPSPASPTSAVMTYSDAAKQEETQAAVSSASQPKPSSYTPKTSSSGKRGLAYNDVDLLGCFASSSLITWAYNWAMSGNGLPTNVKFIPMLWGTKTTINPQNWATTASAAVSNGAQYLFSFNEPDLDTQAWMTPTEAAAAYKQYMQPFAGKAKLVAPSVTSQDENTLIQGRPVGLAWLGNFTQACQGCTFDAFNLHWYGAAGQADYFKNHVQTAQKRFNAREIYITEFGLYDGSTDEQIATFLEDVMPWMDSQDYIKGYSYFMASSGRLINGTEPSAYGKIYASYTG